MKSELYKKTICIIGTACCLNACSIGDWFAKDEEEESARKIYQVAKSSLLNKRFGAAIEKYQELEQKYPFSKHAKNALLESAYAHYKNDKFEETIAMTDRFIKNYPSDPKLDYAYYLQGLGHLSVGKSLVHFFLPRDMSAKNTEPLVKAFDIFSELYTRFPNSIYRPDAKTRLVALRNMLAIHEIRVAAFYLKQGSYIAAINRIKYMLEKYEGAQHTADGLFIMATAYKRLGNHDLAQDTLRVIKQNYPNQLDQNLERIARTDDKESKNWFSGIQDMADVILEKLRIKPRY